MKFARYWRKASAVAQWPEDEPVRVTSFGWSDESAEAAGLMAAERLRRVVHRIEEEESWPEHGYGFYTERPPREEVVEEFADGDGAPAAVVTRNSYGSLILNTSDLVFIDVDIPSGYGYEYGYGGILNGLKSLFGAKPKPEDAENRTYRKITKAAARRPEYTFRVYRTFAGFRCAVVNRRLKAGGPESRRLLEEFGADPLYVKLCQNQRSYRARLTPKYWRCGAHRPPARFPWETAEEEQTYRAWERAYEERCAGFAACRLVGQFGTQPPSVSLRKLVSLHDQYTKAETRLRLA
jgi:hypothetical protein